MPSGLRMGAMTRLMAMMSSLNSSVLDPRRALPSSHVAPTQVPFSDTAFLDCVGHRSLSISETKVAAQRLEMLNLFP